VVSRLCARRAGSGGAADEPAHAICLNSRGARCKRISRGGGIRRCVQRQHRHEGPQPVAPASMGNEGPVGNCGKPQGQVCFGRSASGTEAVAGRRSAPARPCRHARPWGFLTASYDRVPLRAGLRVRNLGHEKREAAIEGAAPCRTGDKAARLDPARARAPRATPWTACVALPSAGLVAVRPRAAVPRLPFRERIAP
jgi:hypothetical protein